MTSKYMLTHWLTNGGFLEYFIWGVLTGARPYFLIFIIMLSYIFITKRYTVMKPFAKRKASEKDTFLFWCSVASIFPV